MRRLHMFYQIVAVICIALILPISANAQGKVTRAKPHAKTITYERTDAFGDNDVVVRAVGSNGKWGAVDRNNKLVIPLKYGFLMPFYEGYAAAYKTKYGKAALIDSNGKELTEFIYDSMNGCNEGRVCVGINGKYGFLDTTGKVVIPIIYDWPNDSPFLFRNGKAKVKLNGETFYIDLQGERIPPETINGITVEWNPKVTPVQKEAVSELLNNMVKIDGGSFFMGDSNSGSQSNTPARWFGWKTVSSFMIDKYETTQKLWRAIMNDNPSVFTMDNLPVEYVSYNDVLKFISTLNDLTGLKFRLPTVQEWEYAAKGGSKSKACKFSGSDNINDVAWYQNNSSNSTQPVGSKKCNELGLYDMTGNVEEWNDDSIYSGGHYSSTPDKSTVTYHYKWSANSRSAIIGFRLVL